MQDFDVNKLDHLINILVSGGEKRGIDGLKLD